MRPIPSPARCRGAAVPRCGGRGVAGVVVGLAWYNTRGLLVARFVSKRPRGSAVTLPVCLSVACRVWSAPQFPLSRAVRPCVRQPFAPASFPGDSKRTAPVKDQWITMPSVVG